MSKTPKFQKKLTVSNTPQNGNYVPGVRIAGKYLETLDFKLGDIVNVVCDNSLIIITKDRENLNTAIKSMIDKNNNLLKLIETFDLKF